MMRFFRTLGIFSLVFSVAGSIAHAQIDFGVDFSISLTPPYPKAGEVVRVEASSALLDLQIGEVVWYVNDKEHARGSGRTAIELVAPSLGEETNVRAVFIEEGFERATTQSTIRPVEVDLLWESDSYTPPWYRGRALPSAGTNLRLEAMPRFVRANGSLVQSIDVVFTWKRNGYVVPGASGRGKSKVLIESPALYGTDVVSVEARSADGVFIGEASVRIPSNEPILSLYENHPLFGVLHHRALSSEDRLSEEEVSFTVIPYFAEARSVRDPALVYAWRVGANPIPNDPTQPNEITVNAEGSSGSARIDLSLTHTGNLFTQVANFWNIFLGAGESIANPFGATE
jgi:hypothetical protein